MSQAASALFDTDGRLIPREGERSFSASDRGYFYLDQPELAGDLAFKSGSLPAHGAFSSLEIDAASETLRKTRESILENDDSRNVFRGAHVPFVLPQMTGHFSDELNGDLLPWLKKRYESTYPGREFRDLAPIQIDASVTVSRSSGWERLLTLRREGPVVGWYFPEALAGYAIPDQRCLVERLPEDMFLSGPSEVVAALALFPELAGSVDGHYGRLLALSAVAPQQSDQRHLFWFLEAYGHDLILNARSLLGPVSEYYAGGLTVAVPF